MRHLPRYKRCISYYTTIRNVSDILDPVLRAVGSYMFQINILGYRIIRNKVRKTLDSLQTGPFT